MPKYNLTSPETGNVYPVNFDGTPTEQDLMDAVNHFDAPVLAQKRLSANNQLREMAGFTIDSPEQEQSDLRTLALQEGSNQISDLERQIQEQTISASSSPLSSALAGAALVPAGIATLGGLGVKKLVGEDLYNQAFPLDQNLDLALNKLNDIAAANPTSAGIGSAGLNAALISSGGVLPGGTILNTGRSIGALARGEIPLAGQLATTAVKEAVPAAIVNAATGAGARALTGQDQSVRSSLEDALLGAAIGGNNPEAAAQLKTGIKAIPEAVKSALNKVPTPFSTTQFKAATQALRPTNKIGTTWNEEFVGRGLGAVKDLGGVDVANALPDQAVGEFIRGSGTTLNKINNAIKAVTENPNGVEVDGTPIVNRILQSVANDKTLAERPNEVQAILDDFRIYNRNIPLDEAERLLEQTNAELFGPLYNRTAEGKKIASSDLQIKAQEALAKGLRDQINDSLDKSLGEKGAGADLKRTYGSVATMKREAQKRYLVALRQAQNSLPEQLAYANSAADIVEGLLALKTGGLSKLISGTVRAKAAKAIKDLNTSDSMIRRAFRQTPEGDSPISGLDFPEPLPLPEYTPADVRFAQELRRQRIQDPESLNP